MIVEKMLLEDGFVVVKADETSAFADPDLVRFDLIVPIFSMGKIMDDESKNLCAAVESGAGLAGFHGGVGGRFRAKTDYQIMTGWQWGVPPGNNISFPGNIIDKTNTITEGVEDFVYEVRND